jgi:hypothetical protein
MNIVMLNLVQHLITSAIQTLECRFTASRTAGQVQGDVEGFLRWLLSLSRNGNRLFVNAFHQS